MDVVQSCCCIMLPGDKETPTVLCPFKSWQIFQHFQLSLSLLHYGTTPWYNPLKEPPDHHNRNLTRTQSLVKHMWALLVQYKNTRHQPPDSSVIPESPKASPMSAISGTEAAKGPSGNLGALSLTSWTLMMNSDSDSKAVLVCRLMACAWRT